MGKNIKLGLLLAMATLFTSGCACSNQTTSITRETSEESSSDISGDTSDTSSIIDPKVSDLVEGEYSKFVPNYYNKLAKLKSFKEVTKGQTVSTVLFVEVVQSIDVTVIKNNDYTYMTNISHSDMVHTEHLAYYHDSKALYKDNNEENYHLKNLNSYLDKYGTYPLDKAIEGYIVNDTTIKTITKVSEGDEHTFTLTLDPEKAPNNVKIQMKQFGGLDDYPSFSEITLAVTLHDDYTPIKVTVDTKYKAKKVMETDCHQTYEVTFSNIDEEIEIPNLSEVTSLFDGEVETE